MKIEKKENGTYRIRKFYKGKSYSVTVKSKPTQKEAEKLINDKIQASGLMLINKKQLTFREASSDYINIKKAVLSPSTIVGYEKIIRQIPNWFSTMNIIDIESYHVQKVINDYSEGRSRKTVANMLGFITPVIKTYKKIDINVTLPQKIAKDDDYIPTDEDVKKIIEYATDTPFEIALILASFGLRRSEICALSLNDLNGSILTIDKAIVKDINKQYVVKSTKTTASSRKITLPDNVVFKIREKGMYDGCPDTINEFLGRALDVLNIQHFTLHKFRHYFATKMSAILPEADVLRLGGWEKSSQIMKVVYRHSNVDRDKDMQKKAADAMRHLF